MHVSNDNVQLYALQILNTFNNASTNCYSDIIITVALLIIII